MKIFVHKNNYQASVALQGLLLQWYLDLLQHCLNHNQHKLVLVYILHNSRILLLRMMQHLMINLE